MTLESVIVNGADYGMVYVVGIVFPVDKECIVVSVIVVIMVTTYVIIYYAIQRVGIISGIMWHHWSRH
jgi:hypothetical protein